MLCEVELSLGWLGTSLGILALSCKVFNLGVSYRRPSRSGSCKPGRAYGMSGKFLDHSLGGGIFQKL